MAITKTPITSSADLQVFLASCAPDFFAEVENDNGIVSCKDADGNTVFKVDAAGGSSQANAYGYADATNCNTSAYFSLSCNAYKTAKGIAFMRDGGHTTAACIVSKTNNGAFAVLLPSDSRKMYQGSSIRQLAIAWGDVYPFTNWITSGAVGDGTTRYIDEQTIFLPIATHAGFGTPSYFADAFFLPVSQYRNECIFEIDGVKYVTDGFVCLRDE